MAIIDADSPGLYLLIVLIVTATVILGKFLYFNFEFFYSIKRMIFTVVRAIADEAYGASDVTQNSDQCNCAPNPTPSPIIDPLAQEIEKDFDSYIVNLAKYLESNKDANRRLDVLNQESSRFIDFNNYLEVIKFFILIGIIVSLVLAIVRLKYRKWLSPLNLILTVKSN